MKNFVKLALAVALLVILNNYSNNGRYDTKLYRNKIYKVDTRTGIMHYGKNIYPLEGGRMEKKSFAIFGQTNYRFVPLNNIENWPLTIAFLILVGFFILLCYEFWRRVVKPRVNVIK